MAELTSKHERVSSQLKEIDENLVKELKTLRYEMVSFWIDHKKLFEEHEEDLNKDEVGDHVKKLKTEIDKLALQFNNVQERINATFQDGELEKLV